MRDKRILNRSCRLMAALSWLTWLILCFPSAIAAAPYVPDAYAHGKAAYYDAASSPVWLRVANRDIVILRSTLADTTPLQRAQYANARIDRLTDAELGAPISLKEIIIGDQSGIGVVLGSATLFVLTRADLDPLAEESLEDAASAAAGRLSSALKAMREQYEPKTWINGILLSIAATAAFLLAIWLIMRLKNHIRQALERRTLRSLDKYVVRGIDVMAMTRIFIERITMLVLWVLLFVVGYVWLAFVLRSFPYTAPWGDELAANVIHVIQNLAQGAIDSAPGILTVIVIFTITRMVVQLLNTFFRAVQDATLSVPFMHPDTAGATRLLVIILIWLFALALAYPHIPGSDSLAFQGISVIAGLMLTLGGTGVINQMMSGLVLVYSRALAEGDMVAIDDTTGVVTYIGLLSTKIETHAHEELTIPNALMVSKKVKNYSRLQASRGATIVAKVSIGYDTAWRQVEAMLIEASRRTVGVRQDIEPHVLQLELANFDIMYELVSYIEQPEQRYELLHALYGNIVDVFNEHEVQIMSPRFDAQPDYKVIVPRVRPPAMKPDSDQSTAATR
ncbi:mechanosensitive ion channel family protein [Noviherbaspirillum cavernae]|nr:mechanosensitive ion channel domain-containing protein [Noviherbaspirillum cavernae]